MNQLSEGHKEKLRNQIITGVQNYNKFLLNKVFKIVCDDNSTVDIRFFSNDFKHLTGLYSNLSDSEFYNNCCNGHISSGNIETNQKYNWSTLKTKGNHIENIQELLYKDGEKILVSEVLDTRTCIFPYAVKNTTNNICVGFVDNINRARSLRKATNSTNVQSEKKICAIFAKPRDNDLYNELVYINTDKKFSEDDSLLQELDENIKCKCTQNFESQKENKSD